MNATALHLELEREMAAIEPEDARHIERALREMLLIARRKNQAVNPSAAPTQVTAPKRYEIKARPLGLRPGLSFDNIGELLAQVEGEDWK